MPRAKKQVEEKPKRKYTSRYKVAEIEETKAVSKTVTIYVNGDLRNRLNKYHTDNYQADPLLGPSSPTSLIVPILRDWLTQKGY